jgi:urea carboxylase
MYILQSLFHHGGVFIERYYPEARHIEIQVSVREA